ncbi:hypothetical protein J7K92_02180 [bacterium]|nr:hypothetical protein [bacterium]
MEDRLSQKEVRRLMKISGNVKGSVILADIDYVKIKGGEGAVKKLKKRMKEIRIKFELEKVKPMEMYPEAISVIIVLLAKEILGLDEKGVFDMGKAAVKLSFFIKILTRYFISPKRCFEESPRYWAKHFDFGELEAVEFDEIEKYAVIRIRGYKFHPIMCQYHRGYFLQIAQLVLGKKEISVEETKCVFRNDAYHEYVISWK